ncbi:hypothetical protein [Limosilactobacillus vaginalis]|uniref:hypothetical protein n=1 Tax=Limosilactobacillus vaginalis TaxID=1633 RepID=UPI0024BB53DF|nr:hypothetical protein [Limosilactobacillus vaginalis]
MIFNQNNQSSSKVSDWHTYYSEDVIARLNMIASGDFIYSGQAAEERRAWNEDTNRYDASITGYGYWVTQNFVDESTGELFKQNPILVVVDGDEIKAKFGDKVKFIGLGGYYSRKKHSYSFKADSMKVIEDD